MDPKAGGKTSEFWLTVISVAVTGLVAYGVVTQEQGAALVNAIVMIVGAVGALAVAVIPVVKYIQARTDLKATAIQAQAEVLREK